MQAISAEVLVILLQVTFCLLCEAGHVAYTDLSFFDTEAIFAITTGVFFLAVVRIFCLASGGYLRPARPTRTGGRIYALPVIAIIADRARAVFPVAVPTGSRAIMPQVTSCSPAVASINFLVFLVVR